MDRGISSRWDPQHRSLAKREPTLPNEYVLTFPECAKRWLHFLNPELNHSAWTEQDDENLLAEVEKNGNNWRKIVDEVLEGRSATDAKNRYCYLHINALMSPLIRNF